MSHAIAAVVKIYKRVCFLTISSMMIARSQKQFLQSILPYICLLVYSFLGALLVYAADLATPQNATRPACVKETGFWGALYYVNTIFTTIGYGSIIVCNYYAKFFTVFLAFLGIPLFLVVLDNVGKIMCQQIKNAYIWFQMKRTSKSIEYHKVYQNSPTKQLTRNYMLNKFIERDLVQVPMAIILTIDFLWILCCTTYFHWSEGWPYLDCLYFTFVSLLTIGLGDYAPTNLNLTLISFGFLAIGLSLISTTINMVQLNIHALIENIRADIEQEYQAKLQKAAEHPSYLAQFDPEESPEDTVERMLRKNNVSGIMSNLVSRNQFDTVATQAAKRSAQHSKSTQTGVDTTVSEQKSRSKPIQNGLHVPGLGLILEQRVERYIDDTSIVTE